PRARAGEPARTALLVAQSQDPPPRDRGRGARRRLRSGPHLRRVDAGVRGRALPQHLAPQSRERRRQRPGADVQDLRGRRTADQRARRRAAQSVEAASQIYYGKHAKQLNVAEAAMLAALPKLPAYYNPRTHPDRAVRRRNVVLGLMRDQGFLTPEECELWRSYPLVLTGNRTNYGDVAPYFVEWLRVQLDAKFGRDL